MAFVVLAPWRSLRLQELMGGLSVTLRFRRSNFRVEFPVGMGWAPYRLFLSFKVVALVLN